MDLRQKIIKLTGEDPVDMFGEDWEEYAEAYLEECREEDYNNKFGK